MILHKYFNDVIRIYYHSMFGNVLTAVRLDGPLTRFTIVRGYILRANHSACSVCGPPPIIGEQYLSVEANRGVDLRRLRFEIMSTSANAIKMPEELAYPAVLSCWGMSVPLVLFGAHDAHTNAHYPIGTFGPLHTAS